MGSLWIANTITDLIQGDVREHLPLESIPLAGDVLGLGTTSSTDNGELIFQHQPRLERTRILKCRSQDGGLETPEAGGGDSHFPYVCFSDDVAGIRCPVDAALLGRDPREDLQEQIGRLIRLLRNRQDLPAAPIYGVRLVAGWHRLVITVASKLCMWQRRRNPSPQDQAPATENIYATLKHHLLAPRGTAAPPEIPWLGDSLEWECCGFWDSDPLQGRVTVPVKGANLHIHGISTDLRFGGHLHHEHPLTELVELKRLTLYPLTGIHLMGSDLAVEEVRCEDSRIRFSIVNLGSLDVENVGVAVVIDDRYSGHRYLRLPWLSAGERQDFDLALELPPGRHVVEVIADPERDVLEPESQRANNRRRLVVRM